MVVRITLLNLEICINSYANLWHHHAAWGASKDLIQQTWGWLTLNDTSTQYRPISVLSVLNNFMKIIINRSILLLRIVQTYLLITNVSISTTKFHSGSLNVTYLWYKSLLFLWPTHVIALDMFKTVDKVWYLVVLNKLSSYVLEPQLRFSIKNYLYNRRMATTPIFM